MPVSRERRLLGYYATTIAQLDLGKAPITRAVVYEYVIQLDIWMVQQTPADGLGRLTCVNHAVSMQHAEDLENAPGYLLDLRAQ